MIERSAAAVDVSLVVPGSKSLTCRHLVLGAIADGTTTLSGALRSADTDALAAAIDGLGVDVQVRGTDITLGGSLGSAAPRHDQLHMGLGGAPARFTMAMASVLDATTTIDGDQPLRNRPLGTGPVSALGVQLHHPDRDDHLPVQVRGGAWGQHHVTVGATVTSQMVSAIMLVAPLAGGVQINFEAPLTSAAYVHLTIAALRARGVAVDVRHDGDAITSITVSGGVPSGTAVAIAADASSAVAATCCVLATPGTSAVLHGVHVVDAQPDTAALSLLQQAGVDMHQMDRGLRIASPEHLALPDTVDATGMPDAVPSLAVLAACRASGAVRFTGLHTLPAKECDRIEATADLLRAAGGSVETTANTLTTSPLPKGDTPLEAHTHHDHRMAFAAAVLGLWRGGVQIDDPDVVAKSWPTFWTDLAPLGGWTA